MPYVESEHKFSEPVFRCYDGYEIAYVEKRFTWTYGTVVVQFLIKISDAGARSVSVTLYRRDYSDEIRNDLVKYFRDNGLQKKDISIDLIVTYSDVFLNDC